MSAGSYREYESFSAFKRAEGAAGEGMEWHHIVEQNTTNKAQFTARQLQNTDNIVAIPKEVHQQVSGYYSRINPEYGVRNRDVISNMSFSDQSTKGRSVLQMSQEKILKKK